MTTTATTRTGHDARGSSSGSSSGSGTDWAPYGKLAAMVATSMVVMYGFTYLNVFDIAHVHWSETRAYMALMMGAAMPVIMLGYMWRMYTMRASTSRWSLSASWCSRSRCGWCAPRRPSTTPRTCAPMIPHHSIAILTSERADIEDPRVRELADGISATQKREIKEMDWLLADIDENGVASSASDAKARPVPEFSP